MLPAPTRQLDLISKFQPSLGELEPSNLADRIFGRVGPSPAHLGRLTAGRWMVLGHYLLRLAREASS